MHISDNLSPFEHLLNEVVDPIILSFLEPRDLARLAEVSQACFQAYEKAYEGPSLYNSHKLSAFAALNDAEKIINSLEEGTDKKENTDNLLALHKLMSSTSAFVLAPSAMIQFADSFKTKFSEIATFEDGWDEMSAWEKEWKRAIAERRELNKKPDLYDNLKSISYVPYMSYKIGTQLDNDFEKLTNILWKKLAEDPDNTTTFEEINDRALTFYSFLFPEKAIDTKNLMNDKYREMDPSSASDTEYISQPMLGVIPFFTNAQTAEKLEEAYGFRTDPSYDPHGNVFPFLNLGRFCFITKKLKEGDIKEAIACAKNMEVNMHRHDDYPENYFDEDDLVLGELHFPSKDDGMMLIAAYIAETDNKSAMEMVDQISDPIKKMFAEKIVHSSRDDINIDQVRKTVETTDNPIDQLTTLLAFATTQSLKDKMRRNLITEEIGDPV